MRGYQSGSSFDREESVLRKGKEIDKAEKDLLNYLQKKLRQKYKEVFNGIEL